VPLKPTTMLHWEPPQNGADMVLIFEALRVSALSMQRVKAIPTGLGDGRFIPYSLLYDATVFLEHSVIWYLMFEQILGSLIRLSWLYYITAFKVLTSE
jgi:hypothetical protein